MVAWTRRRLCLTAERDAEVESAVAPWLAVDGSAALPPRQVVTAGLGGSGRVLARVSAASDPVWADAGAG